jgi:hypothetical protein
MERFFRGVLRHRKLVITLFVILTCLSVACIPQVKIDANMSDYLPTSAKSSQDLNDMKEIYGNDITNARVYVTGISQVDAASFDEQLKSQPGVTSVTWLGDQVDLDKPIEVADADTVKEWYDGDGYLYQCVFTSDVDQAEIDSIRSMAQALPGAQTVAIDGSAVSDACQHGDDQHGHGQDHDHRRDRGVCDGASQHHKLPAPRCDAAHHWRGHCAQHGHQHLPRHHLLHHAAGSKRAAAGRLDGLLHRAAHQLWPLPREDGRPV